MYLRYLHNKQQSRAEETGNLQVHGSAVSRTMASSTPSRNAAVQLVRFELGLLRKSRQHADEQSKATGTPTPVQR